MSLPSGFLVQHKHSVRRACEAERREREVMIACQVIPLFGAIIA